MSIFGPIVVAFVSDPTFHKIMLLPETRVNLATFIIEAEEIKGLHTKSPNLSDVEKDSNL